MPTCTQGAQYVKYSAVILQRSIYNKKVGLPMLNFYLDLLAAHFDKDKASLLASIDKGDDTMLDTAFMQVMITSCA